MRFVRIVNSGDWGKVSKRNFRNIYKILSEKEFIILW